MNYLKKVLLVIAMNFNEKLEKLFQNLNIESPNAPKYIEHIYADYIELNALFLKEEVTIADISDKLQDIHDPNIIKLEEFDEIEHNSDEIASVEAEKQDVIDEKIKSIFEVCKDREKLYSSTVYPFIITDKQIKLQEQLSEKQELYILLLLCSNLNYFGVLQHELTIDFEILSYYALKQYLPPKAIVKPFGKNSGYNGNAINKIKSLASDIGLNVNEKNISCISPQNVQERGCDIVAWIPFSDNIPNIFIILGQCACGKNWDSKQADTEFFKGYFYLEKTPLQVMFIPYAISNMGDKFYQHDRVLNHLFFDRSRILDQFDGKFPFTELKSFPAVKRILTQRIVV